jgi:Gpi18-like mannosyltransferase
MKKKLTSFIPILIISILPTLLIWAPFFSRIEKFWNIPLTKDGMATVVANYDGPLFIVVAKTLYNQQLISDLFSFPLPTQYYAAHFPLFPLLIKPIATITGFPYAMLLVTVASSVLAIYFFHKLASVYVNKNQALWLTFVFSVFPARWLIVRSVGSAEPLFLATIIASVYYFKNKKYLLAGVWGGLAQLTKSPGILLFVAYFFAIFAPKIRRLAIQNFDKWIKDLKLIKYTPILLIPLSLLGLFVFYKFQFNDFLAYFHSGDNIHLTFPPFQIFNYSAAWVGTFWLEEVLFVYLFAALGLVKLIKQKQEVFYWFVGIFFTSILFVSHRDLIRYALPIVPFLMIAFSDTILKKEFRFVMAVLVIPIYLFSLAYISQNTMPISDWAPLL